MASGIRLTLAAWTLILASAPSASAQQSPSAADSDWIGLGRLHAGNAITLRAERSRSRRVTFLAGDDQSLTVYIARDSALPRVAKGYIEEIFRSSPDFLAKPGNRSVEDPKRRVRLSADGVFVAGAKVADWSEVVRRIDRDDVVEVAGKDPLRNGFLIGFAVPVAFMSFACAFGDCTSELIGPVVTAGLLYGLVGMAVDAAVGEKIIYARPDASSTRVRIGPLASPGRKGAFLSIQF